VEHNFIVQRSPKQRMRMTHDRGVLCAFRACIQQRFEASGCSLEKQRSDR